MSFTLKEAAACAREGRIEEWVHVFLLGEGGNRALSDGLKLKKRYWAGPVRVDTNRLMRCCGPEADMEYVLDRDEWEDRIEHFRRAIRSGWDMPPVIAENRAGRLSVRDGNHRLEALAREGRRSCWTIIWDSEDPANLIEWVS